MYYRALTVAHISFLYRHPSNFRVKTEALRDKVEGEGVAFFAAYLPFFPSSALRSFKVMASHSTDN